MYVYLAAICLICNKKVITDRSHFSISEGEYCWPVGGVADSVTEHINCSLGVSPVELVSKTVR